MKMFFKENKMLQRLKTVQCLDVRSTLQVIHSVVGWSIKSDVGF